ncbi:unnamed protein product [Nippostrongylus brasiliensis]|uniref:WD repeat and HMG-box DNA-binding protein 1 (inferred by orthology to a human protein) n=1 Tax=Nippostrongylus brasiliensis TaxID=27835 RepID=A0A158R090_NIPBR|nr:unnamed protein product [Nippostrongylus brasiliensis]
MSFTDVRNVHVKGAIVICTDKAGTSDKFLTCGTDGTVYVWDEKTLMEREAADIKSVGDATHSCCVWNGSNVYVGLTTTDLLTGVDKKIVGQCSLNDLESCRQLFTFSLEVTSIDASDNYVVAGGSDFTVKKVSLKDKGEYARVDTNGEVISVAIDPKEEVYAVACCDGSVTIFDIRTNEKLASHEHMFSSFGDLSADSPRHSLCWSKTGSELFIPSQGCIKVISRDGWSQNYKGLRCTGCESDVFSTSCLSKCGQYLCSSTLSNKIILWKVSDRSVLSQHMYTRGEKRTISSVKFAPFNEKHLIVVDIEEGLCVLKNAVPSTAEAATAKKDIGKAKESAEDKEDTDDDAGDSDRSRSGGFIDNEAEDDGDTRMSVDIGAIKKKYGFGDDGSGKLDDYGFTVSDRPPSTDFSAVQETFPISAPPAPVAPPPQVIEYRPPTIPTFFASSASPDHLTQRYLISFHDASLHPTIVLDNGTTEYVMADLSDQAVALASKAEEKGERSELLVIHISSWDTDSKRWTTKLPLKESALDVLVSQELVCVVTTKRNLRIFSLTGTQRHIIAHPSPILTTACFGNQVAICSIFGGDYYEKSKPHRANFQHVVTIYDADDTINLLTPSGFWIPIFDGKLETTNKSDAIWPIAVTEGRQRQIRYLYCKGSKHPLVAVKMAPLIAPWALPYCTAESDKSKLEQELFLNELQQSEARSSGGQSLTELAASHLQSLVKLFALACKSERDGRAAELAGLVSSAKGIQMMCNYAAKLKRSTLAEKVAAKGRENVSVNEVSFADSLNTSTTSDFEPAPRRLSLKRKTGVVQQRSIFMDEDSGPRTTLSNFDEEDQEDVKDSQIPNSSQQTNDSLLNETVLPARKISLNPFKRSPSRSEDTSSVFDADSSFTSGRKRIREEEPCKPATMSKQQKLSFGSATKGKENSMFGTAYSLWLENNEDTLHGMFSGNPEDFLKFCAQQFRMLPAAEKRVVYSA